MTRADSWPPDDFEEDPRYRIANREALWGVAYWLLFTVVISAVAWLLGGDVAPADIDFVLGFPSWFFWSCLVAAALLSLLPIWIIRRHFTELPLSADGRPDDAVGNDEEVAR